MKSRVSTGHEKVVESQGKVTENHERVTRKLRNNHEKIHERVTEVTKYHGKSRKCHISHEIVTKESREILEHGCANQDTEGKRLKSPIHCCDVTKPPYLFSGELCTSPLHCKLLFVYTTGAQDARWRNFSHYCCPLQQYDVWITCSEHREALAGAPTAHDVHKQEFTVQEEST